MLLSFRFANHRSFRDEQQIDLTPAYEHDYKGEDRPSVPVVGIFGANASGKSNAVNALSYMRYMAVYSDRDVEPGGEVQRVPFRLDPDAASEPSRYVVDFFIDDVRYTYGFSLNNFEILEEWLYSYPLKKRRIIYERTSDKYKFGEEAQRTHIERATAITPPNALFLPVAARARQDLVVPVFTWFSRQVRFSFQHSPTLHTSAIVNRFVQEENKGGVVELLKAADLGLRDVHLAESSVDENEQLDLDFQMPQTRGTARAIRRSRDDTRRLVFTHFGPRGDVTLEWSEESTGTRQLLDLAIKAQRVLREGSLLVVDEIDSSLHPVLTAGLIKLFQDEKTNNSGAQLILTTHDSTLLGSIQGNEVLRRDQIWFVEKDSDGSSTLFPLSDFHPRQQENRQRRYLNGSYGAIPEISDELLAHAVVARNLREESGDDGRK